MAITYTPSKFTPNKPQGLGQFQQFADQAYGQSTARLDPQFQQQEERLNQNLINRGIQPGNEAYDKSVESFGRTKNDAYAGARTDSLAQALAAQGQQFGQDLAGFQANTGEQQFGAQFGMGQEQADFGNLLSLLGYGKDVTAQNNQTLNSDFARSQGLLGLIPGMSPAGVDASGLASLWSGQKNTQDANDAAKQNAQWQAAAQLASAWLGS